MDSVDTCDNIENAIHLLHSAREEVDLIASNLLSNDRTMTGQLRELEERLQKVRATIAELQRDGAEKLARLNTLKNNIRQVAHALKPGQNMQESNTSMLDGNHRTHGDRPSSPFIAGDDYDQNDEPLARGFQARF